MNKRVFDKKAYEKAFPLTEILEEAKLKKKAQEQNSQIDLFENMSIKHFNETYPQDLWRQ